MVGRRNRNRIDGRIVEQTPNVADRSRTAADVAASRVEHARVDVAESGNLDVRDPRKRVEVILPASSKADDGDANAVVGAKDALRPREKREAAERAGTRRRLQEIPPC